MDLKDKIKDLAERVSKLKDNILTEEATKNAFIMPMLQYLGYDVFNPLEVVPEYTSDFGNKKGEKVDYAIFKDNQPVILIECKNHNSKLDINQEAQLFRYFNATSAKFAILTNGIEYKFYTDLDKDNVMDLQPFLKFNVLNHKEFEIEELKHFHKSYFDIQSVYSSANDLKYTNGIKQILEQEFQEPSEQFIRYLAKQVYPGTITERVVSMFKPIIIKSMRHYVSDTITERLSNVISSEIKVQEQVNETFEQTAVKDIPKIVTTQEELDGFDIVKTLLSNSISVERVFYRDAQSYFSIILDDNNRKPICRLWLNGTIKYLELFNSDKSTEKIKIESVQEIVKYSSRIMEIVGFYTEEQQTENKAANQLPDAVKDFFNK